MKTPVKWSALTCLRLTNKLADEIDEDTLASLRCHLVVSDQFTACFTDYQISKYRYIDGLAQDCSNSIANALELLQSFNKPSIYKLPFIGPVCSKTS